MSQSMAKVTLVRLRNGLTYSTMITCSQGDVRQQYSASKVAPDWESNAGLRPVLVFHCISSAQATGETIPANIAVYYDGTRVEFPNLADGTLNTVSGTIPAGMFQIVHPSATDQWKIRIMKNYVTPSQSVQSGHTLRIDGEVTDAGTVSASCQLLAAPLTESGESVTITGETDNPFTVNQNLVSSSCLLRAQLFKGGEPIAHTSEYSYVWERMTASGWSPIAGETVNATGNELTVHPDDVESYGEYRVTVTKTVGGTVADTYSDTQSVMDVGDSLFVAIECLESLAGSSAPLQFSSGAADSEERVLRAKLVSKHANTPIPPIQTCYWHIRTPDGSYCNEIYAGGIMDGKVPDISYSTDTCIITAQILGWWGNTVEITAVVTY